MIRPPPEFCRAAPHYCVHAAQLDPFHLAISTDKRGLVGCVACLLGACSSSPRTALCAAENITSFKTTLAETNAFGNPVRSLPAKSRALRAAEASRLKRVAAQPTTVVVFPATKISGHGFQLGELSLSSVHEANGSWSKAPSAGAGAIVDAARIFLEPRPGEVDDSGRSNSSQLASSRPHPAAKASPSKPATDPSTRSKSPPRPPTAEPGLCRASRRPTLSDVARGDYVGVSGSLSGTTVTATGVVIATPQAGGHPDLTPPSRSKAPALPKPPRTSSSTPPPASSATPARSPSAPPADFALDQCPPNSQAGLITIHANYEGNPDYLLGTAPIFSIVPQEGETARFSFIVPDPRHPDRDPRPVRTTSDYGLRFTVKDITQLTPLAAAKLTFWGFPADPSHEAQRFPKGNPGNPTGCPEEEGTACIPNRPAASITPQPLIDNPTDLHRQRLDLHPRSRNLRRPHPPPRQPKPPTRRSKAAKTRSSNRSSRPPRPPTRPTPPRA